MDPVIFSWDEEAKPIHETLRICARVEEVHRQEVRHGPGRRASQSIALGTTDVYVRICALHLEHVVPGAMNILRPLLHHTVRQALHVLDLLFTGRIPVLIIMVSEHRSPWDPTLCDRLRKLSEYRSRVPGGALPVQLIA